MSITRYPKTTVLSYKAITVLGEAGLTRFDCVNLGSKAWTFFITVYVRNSKQ